MSYILNQFNQALVEPCPTNSSPNTIYMTPIETGTAEIKSINPMDPTAIVDQCVKTVTFETNKSYYFHGQIKKMENDQIFYVYLIKFESDPTLQTTKKQYIKTLIVNGGDTEEWTDVELVFSPLAEGFDCIIFQLKREAIDVGNPRVPVILYQELDLINNAVGASGGIPCVGEIVKMGIQAHEGLHTVINNESIHIGKSELYEIKNGVITVYSFSVVSAATESSTIILPIESRCDFATSKVRGINPFTIDYIYDDGEEV